MFQTQTYHVVHIFEYVGQTVDDEGKFVLGDVDQTFFIVLCTHFGVGALLSCFNWEL